jgi:SAM-dependent methyltransferase
MFLDKFLRRLIPSAPVFTRSPLFYPLSLASDLSIGLLYRLMSRRAVPPLRYMCRTGVGNNILFPHASYMNAGTDFWMYAFSQGWARLDSRIVDIGCGCGKIAAKLRDFVYMRKGFGGHYFGFDVDAEMVDWCQKHFPPERFTFRKVDAFNSVWNPTASKAPPRLMECASDTIDLVISHSLFSHLLEEDIKTYLLEAVRTLRPGGAMAMTFFCLEDMSDLRLLGGRWTFPHRIGNAQVETMRYPEAAVGYKKDFMIDMARAAGFTRVEVILPDYQSTLFCIK